jgi:methyl-accepting chemotaxis protein
VKRLRKKIKRIKKANLSKVIKNRKLPILTLDSRWHEIFPEEEKTSEIKDIERKLNELLAKQGKLVNEIKDYKKIKKNLMNEIVANMDTNSGPTSKQREKKLDRNKQYILEINKKIDDEMEELSRLPYQIKEINEELLVESISICYDRISKQMVEINEISDWIKKAREELKIKILQKQDMENKNTLIYSYMHDILGAELMERFDENHKIE